MRFEFGFNDRKKLTGAGLAVLVMQISSLLPLLYIILFDGYPAVITRDDIVSWLFDLGITVIPRWEALMLSVVYRRYLSELAVYFLLAGIAFLYGIAAGKLLKSDSGKAALFRKILIVLLGLDLVIRVLPFRFNRAFGMPFAISSFLIRLGCLVLVLNDFRAAGKRKNAEAAG